jgi:hypothetical protein
MITPFLLGAGGKLLVNCINNGMHYLFELINKPEKEDSPEVINAKTEQLKAIEKDTFTKVVRGLIFLMIIGVWCYLAIYGAHNPKHEYDIVVPKGNNWTFGSLFSSSQWEIRKISGSVLMWQWFTLVEMILGFFVVPSRRR